MRVFPAVVLSLILLLAACDEQIASSRAAVPPARALAGASAPAEQVGGADARAVWNGRAGRVFDGDSLVVVTDAGRRVEVRIEGIDAPERGQPFSRRSRSELMRLLRGQALRIEPRKRDRYGRTVAVIRVGERDAGEEMIARGYAWHYRAYADEQHPPRSRAYARAEELARSARRGIWRDDDPVAPWQWRRERRERMRQ